MAGCRGGNPRLGAPSPRLWCMVLGSSLLVSAVSGGKSTMRKTVPPRGGMMPMSIAARSALPERSAGVSSVTHSSRDTVCACGRTFLCGLAPSSNTTALSLLSMVVTTRRTFALKAMMAFPPAFARAARRPIILCQRDVVGLDRLGIDQHESDIGRFIGAVAPGVIGAALNQDVAGLEQNLALVHQRVNLTRQHDGVIHRAGLVKAGMARRAAIERGAVTGAVVGAGALALERDEALPVRRIFDDAEDRPVLGRREPKGMVGGLGIAAIVGGHCPRLPQFGHHRAALRALVNVRRRRIHDEHGAASGVAAGHDPADRLGHRCLRGMRLWLHAALPRGGVPTPIKSNRGSHLPLDHHPLDLGDGLGRIEALRAGLGAVHDGVAAVEAERVLEIVEALPGRLVAAVLEPAVGLKQRGGSEEALAVPPIARAGGRAARAQDTLVEAVEL